MIKEEILKELFSACYDSEESFEKLYYEMDLTSYEFDREYSRVLFKNKLTDIRQVNKETEDNLEMVSGRLEKDLDYLNFKITKAVQKLKGAILAERNTTSTIYTTIIPITEQETNNQTTTATIKDNIVFGITSSNIDLDLVEPLNLQNISLKGLEIKSINKTFTETLTDFEISNKNHNSVPVEFSIDLRGLIKESSLLVLKLKQVAILEVYINGNLYREKELNNYFSIPIDLDTQSIGIRSYPTLHKSSKLHFDMIGITGFLYQEESVFETKQIPINREFTDIVLDTCDNSLIDEVDIQYYVSLNKQEYQRVNPSTKQSGKYKRNLQSIIGLSTNKELDLIKITGSKRAEGNIQFQIPSYLQNYLEYETDVYFINKHKELIPTYYLLIKEDVTVDKTASGINRVDNVVQEEDTFLIPKGIRLVEINSITTLKYQYLENIIGVNNIFINKLTVPIYKEIDNNKYISLSVPDILTSVGTYDIPEIYIKNVKQQINLNTIKLKIILKSLNQKTTPYVSRILLRGI